MLQAAQRWGTRLAWHLWGRMLGACWAPCANVCHALKAAKLKGSGGCRQLSAREQAQRSASWVHLGFSLAASCAAAAQLALYLATSSSAAAHAQADIAVRCAAGFFAFRLWTLVHQG